MLGDKAKHLHTLQELNLSVPEFYEIDAQVLGKLDDPVISKKLADEFSEWSKEHNCQSVAVRSSAEGEDGAVRSFAGQYVSVMNVATKDSFLKALRKVSGSKPSLAYSHTRTKVHAIVQRYIEPDVAGVLFTVNPASGRSEMLINATTGHGSRVVEGGEATSIHIDRVTGDVRAADESTILSQAQVRELRQLGEIVEAHKHFPQDIEWAFSASKLYALQTRPITRIAHLQVWDNANIGESFPGIVSPLTFSISRRGYELVYKSQGYEAGLDWYQLERNHRTFNAMVGLFAGRMYYNLASWYRFIGLFPNNSQNQKHLDEQLQTIGDAAYLPPSHYPLGYKLRFYTRAARRTLLFEREKKRYWRYLEKCYQKYESLPTGRDLFILLDRYAFIEQTIIPHMGRSADNDFFVMIYHGILKSKLRRWFGEESTHSTDFLGALHGIISARQANLLSEIADTINNDQQAAALLEQEDYKRLDKYLLSTKAGGLITEYREKFLHRFAEDQKIEAKNPLLPLSGFYGLVKAYRQLDTAATRKRQQGAATAEQKRNDKIIRQLRLGRRWLYRLLLSRLKHHLRIREHNRLLRGKAYAYLRALFIQVGEVLQATGQIEQVDDVYYLDIEELFRLINGTGYNEDIKQIIRSREKNYERYQKMKAPSRFITTALTDKLPKDFADSHVGPTKTTGTLTGTISSPGNIEGRVMVLDKPIVPKEPFDILVVSHTDPGWTPLIALAKGLVVEHGGILSHAAIVTRELGIPSIIGVKGATEQLESGMKIRINAAKAAVEIL